MEQTTQSNQPERGHTCPFCHKPMQLNAAASSSTSQQFICGCQGSIFHLNVHRIAELLRVRSSANRQ